MSFPYNSDEEECAAAEYGIDNTIDLTIDNDNISIVATISDESSYASTDITPDSQQVEYIFDLTEDDTSSAEISLLDKLPLAESDVTTPVIHDNQPNMNVTSSKLTLAKKIICKSCLNFMVIYTNYIYSRCVFCNNAI
ncbi:uncharacterized protein LOC132941472 [Metopolophium dirhodum]|uniref:uncharacterized protein LOC132941472 n=1 Tax=Metopolophium dirhodum TaxID=44670 RepID=UPI00298FCB46|nr:uncharacterized protein LOC132941472 [Metopolophium dirhodum]XP_060865525.1 uncharacterized protein LOC132941472 [Metopolophium dirhodum]XP_060865526.1 uncharacterized protein LOC132941472 [Metopolophium dirhodum]XP_060865527.1 uncharacterized protein LOC132941472 [Metopolophium dirhodum]XP_060865528.1 uncharacterized protein LOC132941472 [Metopolophium dirhodum]XP_060865529.1 uncharacterized protein LOC132941472 [Metopolophium dirhodum]XP_060865530.1 uncharacterized protein LOC132941472 [